MKSRTQPRLTARDVDLSGRRADIRALEKQLIAERRAERHAAREAMYRGIKINPQPTYTSDRPYFTGWRLVWATVIGLGFIGLCALGEAFAPKPHPPTTEISHDAVAR